MLPLVLRPAQLSDVSQLVPLINSAYRGDESRAGWTTEADLLGGQRTDPDSLGALIAQPDRVVLIAEAARDTPRHARADAGVGCVYLERVEWRGTPAAYLGMLTIRPTSQGGGLGGVLLRGAEAHAGSAWGAACVRMTVIAQRSELIAWYERRGYTRTGETEPFPYGDARFGLPLRPDLHFIVLQKTLTRSSSSS
jgi:ribosomal protein S18 acetylase RimI-like enzyme